MDKYEKIAQELGVSLKQIDTVLSLTAEGSTIPFIARYRKDMTGNLDEVAIKAIIDRDKSLTALAERKETVLAKIEEQGKLTEALKQAIEAAEKLADVEELYLPYKEKRRTKATIAREAGLFPLARLILQNSPDLEAEAQKFTCEAFPTETAALAGAVDILVEAMGRVNFDKSIHDRKGITEKVELVSGDRSKELKNWTVYSFPVDYSFIKNKNYQDTKILPAMPAYYKTTFKLDKVGDTFLDMSTWGKGMVWVNGHAMGRFWEIGPQQTLFMPGCWLKKGVNEIIVLDLKGPKEATIVGLNKPILDMLRVAVPETHRKQGQTIKLEKETPVSAGTFKPGNGWQEVKVPVTKGRYFCLEGLSSFDNTNIAAIAEFDVLDEKGQKISRENWKIVYADSEETRSGNRTADKIYDLQESTFWQTVDNTAYPHQVVIDLGKEYNVTGFRILPRAEQGAPGMIKDYKVYVKATGFDY